MTAKITDINEYRARKNGDERTYSNLARLTDNQVRTRLEVLRLVEQQGLNLETAPVYLVNNLFPEGYDRENHREDDYATLLKEAERRGVTTR